MKYHYLFSFILIVMLYSCSEEKKSENSPEKVTSTFYFIRHAEKDRSDSSNRDPHLTEIGKARAVHWSEILGKVKFDAIYSTNYTRTKETAQPTATKNHLVLTIYDPNTIKIDSFKTKNQGKNVLIVGHSNTTPEFVNSILGHKKYDDIDDSNNGNLYIVTVTGDVITDELLVIN